MPTNDRLLAEHKAGLTYSELAAKYRLNVDGVRGRVSKAYRKSIAAPRYSFTGDDEPQGGAQPVFNGMLHLRADQLMIAGDLHIPSTNYPLIESMTELALKHMKPPRGLLICGDLSNGDQDSAHAPLAPTISRARELVMLEDMLSYLLIVFDHIWLTPGNHLRNRLMKTLSADMTANHIKRLFTPPADLDRVTFSWYDLVHVTSGDEPWIVTHQYQYRQTKLSIANDLAQKYQANTITFHQHHTASGMDKYERYAVIDCGGLHDQEMMAYTQLVPSTRPRMNSGFVYLHDGTGSLLTPYKALTSWSLWGVRAPWEPPPTKRTRVTSERPALKLEAKPKRAPRKKAA
jgi:hypothetical protein